MSCIFGYNNKRRISFQLWRPCRRRSARVCTASQSDIQNVEVLPRASWDAVQSSLGCLHLTQFRQYPVGPHRVHNRHPVRIVRGAAAFSIHRSSLALAHASARQHYTHTGVCSPFRATAIGGVHLSVIDFYFWQPHAHLEVHLDIRSTARRVRRMLQYGQEWRAPIHPARAVFYSDQRREWDGRGGDVANATWRCVNTIYPTCSRPADVRAGVFIYLRVHVRVDNIASMRRRRRPVI